LKSLEENLTQYAACHRDRRNIATHFLGIPLIVFAAVLALATVAVPLGEMTATLAVVASVCASLYYFRLDAALATAMAVTFFLMCAAASEITARCGDAISLGIALAAFVAGWALQLWGHRFEGLKPAFLEDARQLLIGPLFVAAEVFFFFGAKPELRRHIEERVGPTVARRTAATPTGSQ
jgi:uncharacterized membrane protein YGL010W